MNGWFDREFPECRPIISGSRKTISAAIIAATAPSEPEAKIASGVHSVRFWFAKRLRQLRLAMLYKSIWSTRVSALKEKSEKFPLIFTPASGFPITVSDSLASFDDKSLNAPFPSRELFPLGASPKDGA